MDKLKQMVKSLNVAGLEKSYIELLQQLNRRKFIVKTLLALVF
jgi:hypothetical protein